MATLLEDIHKQSEWIVKAFASEKFRLDFSIDSFIEIDRFFNKYVKDGKGIKGGILEKNYGPILWGIGAYVGETIIKVVPGSIWIADDDSPEGELGISVKLPGDILIWPVLRVMKRFKNGEEDSIYVYGHQITVEFTGAEFNSSYWDLNVNKQSKPWWKFW